jgi:hypothetical protein
MPDELLSLFRQPAFWICVVAAACCLEVTVVLVVGIARTFSGWYRRRKESTASPPAPEGPSAHARPETASDLASSGLPVCPVEGVAFVDALHEKALEGLGNLQHVGAEPDAGPLPVTCVRGRLFIAARHPQAAEAIRALRARPGDKSFTSGVSTLRAHFGEVALYPKWAKQFGWAAWRETYRA